VSGPGGSRRDAKPSLAEAVDGPGMSAATAAPATAAPTRHSRSRPRQTRRRRARWVALFLLLAAMALAGGVTWALYDSSLFAVRSVTVTGTRLVPESEVLAVAGVRPGTLLIRVSTARVAARVLTITQVQGVQVTKTWPDRVVIAVRERTSALAVALSGGGFDLIDADGVIVQSAATRPAGLPLFTTTAAASSLRGDPDVAAAAAVLGELPASLRSSVASVIAPSPDQVTLSLGSGVTILWGGAGDPAAKARELAILMQTHARSYDVSSPATAVTN
jgi:cell division protein FtsQ